MITDSINRTEYLITDDSEGPKFLGCIKWEVEWEGAFYADGTFKAVMLRAQPIGQPWERRVYALMNLHDPILHTRMELAIEQKFQGLIENGTCERLAKSSIQAGEGKQFQPIV